MSRTDFGGIPTGGSDDAKHDPLREGRGDRKGRTGHSKPVPESRAFGELKRLALLGDWVRIQKTILMPGERAPNIPVDTRKTPFQMWVNGFLQDRTAAVGDEVTIRTAIGRLIVGRLVAIGPRYEHDFGSPQPELLSAIADLRRQMKQHE